MNKKIWFFGVALVGLTVYVSCRKADRQIKMENGDMVEERFFNSHESSEPLVQAILKFMKGQNDKYHFVERTVKQMGYPYWDKTMLYSMPEGSHRGASDTSYVAYIPLVQPGENQVDAQLTVKVTPTDTTYSFLNDYHYDNFGFDPNADSLLNALKIFCLFANHEKNVFGRTKFAILDNRIFRGQTAISIDTTKLYMIELDTINSNRANVMAGPPPLPQSSCILVNEMIAAGYSVTYSMVGGTCVISSYSFGGVPPEEPGGSGGGWAPGGSGSNPSEPIDTLLKRYSEFANRYRDSLSNLCESEHKERFYNIVNYNNLLDTFRVLTSTTDEEIKPNYYMIGGRILKAEWHYHPKYSDGTPGSWPSGGDVVKLYDKPAGHVMIIDTYDARYALVVEDLAKMTAWKNIFGNGPQILPFTVYNAVLNDPRVYSTGSTYVNMTKEKILAALGSSGICGIGLYQSNSANGTTFIKIN